MATKLDASAVCADLVGHDDGKLSVTIPVAHEVVDSHSVAIREGVTCHLIIAKCSSAVLPKPWLAVYQMRVSRTGEFVSRSYWAFNHATDMKQAKDMQADLIRYAHNERDIVQAAIGARATQLELG